MKTGRFVRHFALLSACAAIAGIVGCEPPTGSNPSGQAATSTAPMPPPPPGAPAPSGTLPPGTIDAKDATGVWNRDQVTEYLKGEMKLTELTLTPTTANNYDGVGKNAEGANVQFTVAQVPGGIAYRFTTDRGGSGGGSFGNKVPGF